MSCNKPLEFPCGIACVGLGVGCRNTPTWEIEPPLALTAFPWCLGYFWNALLTNTPLSILGDPHLKDRCLWWVNHYWFLWADQRVEAYCWRPGEGEGFLLRQIAEHWADLPGERRRERPSAAEDCGNSLCHRCKSSSPPVLPHCGKLSCFFCLFSSLSLSPLNLWPDTIVMVRPQAWLGSPEECVTQRSKLKKVSLLGMLWVVDWRVLHCQDPK